MSLVAGRHPNNSSGAKVPSVWAIVLPDALLSLAFLLNAIAPNLVHPDSVFVLCEMITMEVQLIFGLLLLWFLFIYVTGQGNRFLVSVFVGLICAFGFLHELPMAKSVYLYGVYIVYRFMVYAWNIYGGAYKDRSYYFIEVVAYLFGLTIINGVVMSLDWSIFTDLGEKSSHISTKMSYRGVRAHQLMFVGAVYFACKSALAYFFYSISHPKK